jgi:hypothetical protein
MNNFYSLIRKTSTIGGIIMATIGFLTADIFNFYAKASKYFLGLANTSKDYSFAIDSLTKLLIVACIIILGLIWYSIFSTIENSKSVNLKKTNIEDVITFVENKKDIKSIIIVGYSLSFVEQLKTEFQNRISRANLDITIKVPSTTFITNYLEDDMTTLARTSELDSRAASWSQLQVNQRVRNVTIKRVEAIPVENAIAIDEDIVYIDYYDWNTSNSKFRLFKKSKKDRGFLKILKRHGDLFKYVQNQIVLK